MSPLANQSPVLVVGIGSAAGDDALGPEVAARVARELAGSDAGAPAGEVQVVAHVDPTELVELMDDRALVVIADATRSAGRAGMLVLREVGAGHPGLIGWAGGPASSHGWGLAEAVELARVLGRLPERVVVVGVTADRFEPGAALSAPVAHALPHAVEAVLSQVRLAT